MQDEKQMKTKLKNRKRNSTDATKRVGGRDAMTNENENRKENEFLKSLRLKNGKRKRLLRGEERRNSGG
jgi:hypothetical protein